MCRTSHYIQCTLHVCSGLLMWTFFFLFHSRIFFLKKDGEESHARMFYIYPQLAYAETIYTSSMNNIHDITFNVFTEKKVRRQKTQNGDLS
jgi:hypothetical protein